MVVLLPSQIKALNLLWSSFNECVEINGELTFQIQEYDRILDLYASKVESLEDLIFIKNSKIETRDMLIESCNTSNKGLNRKIKRLKTSRAGIGTLFTAAIAYIVYSEMTDK